MSDDRGPGATAHPPLVLGAVLIVVVALVALIATAGTSSRAISWAGAPSGPTEVVAVLPSIATTARPTPTTMRRFPSPTATPRPPTTPAPLLRYQLGVIGLSVAMPADWRFESFQGQHRIRFTARSGTTFTISDHRPLTGSSADDWAAASVPDRASTYGGHRWCMSREARGIMLEGSSPSSFETTQLLGHHAVTRGLCGYVDAVIDFGDRVIALSLHSAMRRTDGDRATFRDLIERVGSRAASR